MGKKGLRLVEADDAVPLTGAQVYREAALFTADFLERRVCDMAVGDRLRSEIEADVRNLRARALAGAPVLAGGDAALADFAT